MTETAPNAPPKSRPRAKPAEAAAPPVPPPAQSWRERKRVLVLQGGGALGSYQAGVCEGLAREAMGPSWVAGISIGAINAALMVGNPPGQREERIRQFWERATSGNFYLPFATNDTFGRSVVNQMSAAYIATFGAPGFFRPRFPGPLLATPETAEALSFYDTTPLRQTLEELVDFDRINHGHIRLSVGAVDIETGNNVLFDNTKMTIGPEHIMASGALPPGFPPVWIEGRAYWDGGLVSNTPLEFVLDEETHEDLLIFQVDLFNARGPMPQNLLDAEEREKDIRYSSRTRLNTDSNMRIHRIKMALQRLIESLPPGHGDEKDLKLLRRVSKENAVAIVQLIYRKRAYEGGSKDYEFSRQTMLEHWATGLADVEHFFAHAEAQFAAANGTGVVVIDPGLPEHPTRSDPA
ncbi:MAG: patatin-like phospholipase family protein [Caulobacteraceae bacterium]